MSDSPSKGHPLHLSISQSSSGSLSCPSRDGGPPPFPNTPSKHKSSVFAGSKQYYYSQRAVNKFWRNTRWILLGFGIGAATTALFHAVNIPTIRVELEYADAPGMLETSTTVLNKAAKAAHLSAPVSLHTKEQQPPKQQETKYRQKGDQEMDNLAETDDQVDNDEGETKAEREEDVEQVGLANDEEGDINDDTNPGSLRSQNDASQRSKDAALKFQLPKIGTSTDANNTAIKSAPKTQTQIYPLPGDPVFDNVPPPPTLDENEDFAACLLIKDDNHWLVEWLAYHYHVMPMRDLIVAVDPESKTSPMRIINRWRDSGLMRIDVWNDTQFMPKQIKGNLRLYDNNTELMVHRTRQNNFYFKCINKFRNRKKEWLMLVDTDEYIVTNYASGLYFNITKNIPISKPGNVLTFIKQHHQLTRENHTCLYEPRFMFGVKEQTSDEIVNRHMPQGSGLNGYDFLTQRFIYRNPRRMHNGKNLLNLNLLPPIKKYASVHHVSDWCPDPDKMRTINHVRNSLVKIHHYLGTEEQYFFRSDPRQYNKNTTNASNQKKKKKNPAYFTRGQGRYNTLNARAIYPDQAARAWIKGFIKDVGLEQAKLLLEGIGQVGYE